MRFASAVAVLALLASPSLAVTITASDTAPTGLTPFEITNFVGSGRCGTGGSVIGDGCSTVIKNAASPNPYGRSAATPDGSWDDSNDLPNVAWAVDFDGQKVTRMSFRVSDANDQPASFFRIATGGAVWESAARQANGAVNWITVAFDSAVSSANILFTTSDRRAGDGFGVSNAGYCPVPR